MPITPQRVEYTPNALKAVLRAFLPADLWNQFTFRNENGGVSCADDRVKYYGNDKEFLESCEKFRWFTGSSTKLGMELADPYTMKPVMYENLQGQPYVLKQDQLVVLQNMMHHSPFERRETTFIYAIIGYYLKAKENLLNGCWEFVPVDCAVLDVFISKTMGVLKDLDANIISKPPENSELPELTIEDVFNRFKTMLPLNDKDPNYTSIFKLLEEFDHDEPLKDHQQLYRDILIWCETVFGEFENFIKSRPDWYLPNSVTGRCPSKTMVRLYQDLGRKFLMGYDLLPFVEESAANLILAKAEKGILLTIQLEELVNQFKIPEKFMDFMKVEIQRADNRCQYLPSVGGKYCIPASDLLLEILIELISFKGIFQYINESNWKVVLAFFKEAQNIFDCNLPGPYFVDVDVGNELRKKCNAHFDKHKGTLFEERRKLSPVGPAGFNLEDLKRELKGLGLMDGSFKKAVPKFAEHVFVKRFKKGQILRDSDMSKAVEEVQQMCVFTNIPKLNKFLHIQGSCSRAPFACEFCNGRQKITNRVPELEKKLFKDSGEEPPPLVEPINELKNQKKKEKKKRQNEQRKQAVAELTVAKQEKMKYEDLEKKNKELMEKLDEIMKRETEKDDKIEKLTEKVAALEASLVHYIQNR